MQGSIVSNFRLFLVLLISSVIVVSCGGGGGGSNELPKTDTTKPTVTITPETSAVGQRVPVTKQITAKFSKSMDGKSVIAGFSVVPNNNGTIQYEMIVRKQQRINLTLTSVKTYKVILTTQSR